MGMEHVRESTIILHKEENNRPVMKSILYSIRGALSVLLLMINTLFWFTPMMTAAILKLLLPFKFWRSFFGTIIHAIAIIWISTNNLNIAWTRKIKWNITGMDGLSVKNNYLVISNHQSWADIVILQNIFNRKIPFLKFFLKKELIWVPFLGVAWWALDYPFMKRYSSSFIEKNPHLKGKDIEITRKACEKFKSIPVSVMNFVEGTRYTEEKHSNKKSPFNHLLKPKAGGIGFVLSTMGDQLDTMLNVTIIYPEGDTGFWSFLCGWIKEITVIIEQIPITEEMLGDYTEDEKYREWFQKWLNELWHAKDDLIEKNKFQ
jgi:1-acyl-sn-glycerol-3-phosphate acyltransferase